MIARIQDDELVFNSYERRSQILNPEAVAVSMPEHQEVHPLNRDHSPRMAVDSHLLRWQEFLENRKIFNTQPARQHEDIIPEASPTPSLPWCRICLSDREDDSVRNPFVSPCYCKGTMSLVHINCLRMWLQSKRETRETPTTSSFQWTLIRCELCQFLYPMSLVVNGTVFPLFQFDKPIRDERVSFIVFETVYQQKEVKTIHVVSNAKDKKASIGRAFDAGMRVPDISVSRYHAYIEFKNNHFYLSDNESKFGTLLLMQKPLVIDPVVFAKNPNITGILI